jgi:hypothetical protein
LQRCASCNLIERQTGCFGAAAKPWDSKLIKLCLQDTIFCSGPMQHRKNDICVGSDRGKRRLRGIQQLYMVASLLKSIGHVAPTFKADLSLGGIPACEHNDTKAIG